MLITEVKFIACHNSIQILSQGGCPMYNLFAFAIGARLVAFIVFVACVYAGNLLFAKLERRQTKFLWKMTFVTLYSLFLLLVTYVVWFVFYFELNAQMPCLCWGFLFGDVEIVDLRHENSTPSIKMRWSLHFSNMT